MALRTVIYLFIVVGFATSACESPVSKEDSQTPNIVLIMSDDHGWYDTGFNGNTEIKTPHLDSLAGNGIIFDRFYSASAVCSPTRASVLTGRNPLRTDIPYANSGHLREEEITLAEILKQEGYATGHFGKWHLGTLTKTVRDANRGGRAEFIDEYSIPTQHGYDTYFATESKVPIYDPMVFPADFDEGENKRYGWKAIESGDSANTYGTYYWTGENQRVTNNLQGDNSRVIMDRVLSFVENAASNQRPFFTTVWLHTPHLPVVSDSVHRSIYNDMNLRKQLYYGAITAMDEQIGRLWNQLEQMEIAENTIIFYCSDNGPEVRTPGSAGIFRSRKRSLYEGGVRVPAFVIWKDHLESGKRIDFPVVTSDYLPTILDILDLEYPDDRPLDGISVMGALNGTDEEREKPIGFICRPNISWVTHQYKLIGKQDSANFELYDLLNDKAEQKNIADELPGVAQQLKDQLRAWESSVENSRRCGDYFK